MTKNSALLLGSVLAFIVLAAPTIATRQVAWFALSTSLKGSPELQ